MDEITRLIDQLASVDQRLRMLEGGSRTGLSGLRSAWMTQFAEHTVFDAWDSGPVAALWADDLGNTGTGYPTLTVANCPTRYLIMYSVRVQTFARGLPFRSEALQMTVSINGNDTPSLPNAYATFANQNANLVAATISKIAARDEPPGTKTFQLRTWCFDNVPAGVARPTLADIYLGVLPLAVA